MSEFAHSLHEVFERLGRVEMRRMFGGHGVYHEGRMFGLIAGNRLYLKVDAESAAYFVCSKARACATGRSMVSGARPMSQAFMPARG